MVAQISMYALIEIVLIFSSLPWLLSTTQSIPLLSIPNVPRSSQLPVNAKTLSHGRFELPQFILVPLIFGCP